MPAVEFKALEYDADGSFQEATYRYEGDTQSGWRIAREGRPHLDLPAGYRLLRSVACGICSTDLARRYLPFPLPQIIGHEVIAREESGKLVTAEINASHFATDSPAARDCPLCRAGLHTHCPERLTFGIDRLPGGFAPWILIPWRNVVEVSPTLPPEVAVLIEPFAAALHAAGRMHLEGAKRVAVLGVGRLGLLVVAALAVRRRAVSGAFSIEAVDRQEKRLALARTLGADQAWSDLRGLVAASGNQPALDVVVESTGSPAGLEAALGLASREVHVKSTTGRETFGLKHLTEMVVDEVSLAGFRAGQGLPLSAPPGPGDTALMVGTRIDAEARRSLEAAGFVIEQVDSLEQARAMQDRDRPLAGRQASVVVVDSVELIDRVLRPRPDLEQGLVRPRGTILLAGTDLPASGLAGPLLAQGLRISTSRCGDFHQAIAALESLTDLGVDLGRIITDRLPVSELAAAFERAVSTESIKVVTTHAIGSPTPPQFSSP